MTKKNEPVQDAMKAYLELALGLTEASRKKAEKTVKKVTRDVLGRSGATAAQIQSMAEDLITTSAANRDAIGRLVRVELERALDRLGLVRTEEAAALANRVDALEQHVADLAAAAPAAEVRSGAAVAVPPAAPQAPVVKKAVKAPAKKTVAVSGAGTTPETAKKTARKAVAKKAVKAPAKKAVKAPAKRTAAGPEAAA